MPYPDTILIRHLVDETIITIYCEPKQYNEVRQKFLTYGNVQPIFPGGDIEQLVIGIQIIIPSFMLSNLTKEYDIE